MTKRKLIITRNLNDTLLNNINEIIPDWEVVVSKDPKAWEHILSEAEIIAGWTKEIVSECMEKDSKLQWLQTWSAGVNSVPLQAFSSKKISITSANGVHAFPISETIFALLLALTRKIHTYVKNQQTKTWENAGLKLELHRKTIGIIGVGAIGKETAKIAQAFGMKVLGVRHSYKEENNVDEMYTTEELNLVLPQCDYVVITLPLTKDTYRLFGKEQFQLMKNSAFLVNIGRGDIIVEKELIEALQNDIIGGVGLDVFEQEPLSEDSPLWEMDNVIITPHTAGATEYYNERLINDIFIPNLKSYVRGEKLPINVVDFQKGY
ncbi:D-2-hydroxyacid dehydrogenase [Evansella sp. AB-P1]|uniref:D-2-hydroxyacid dehydrogenase n=1 Tax=Evansella sp. AB-P1 TaxID=3037653 RepID=UPI00241E4154|nr:D-2-hydroxyacid dehydrogenase [Evansella sp. AB-P1]MDG5786205.1 D-2-hydroxyacid dehydrogenase [Evansella sp. AB-P1]